MASKVIRSDEEYKDFLFRAKRVGSLDVRHGNGDAKKAKKLANDLFHLLTPIQVVPAEFVSALPGLVRSVGFNMRYSSEAHPTVSERGKTLSHDEFCDTLADNYLKIMVRNKDRAEEHQDTLIKEDAKIMDSEKRSNFWALGIVKAALDLERTHPLQKRHGDWIAANPWVWTKPEIIRKNSLRYEPYTLLELFRDAPGRDPESFNEYPVERAFLVRRTMADYKASAIVKFNEKAELDYAYASIGRKDGKPQPSQEKGLKSVVFLHDLMKGEEGFFSDEAQALCDFIKPRLDRFQKLIAN